MHQELDRSYILCWHFAEGSCASWIFSTLYIDQYLIVDRSHWSWSVRTVSSRNPYGFGSFFFDGMLFLRLWYTAGSSHMNDCVPSASCMSICFFTRSKRSAIVAVWNLLKQTHATCCLKTLVNYSGVFYFVLSIPLCSACSVLTNIPSETDPANPAVIPLTPASPFPLMSGEDDSSLTNFSFGDSQYQVKFSLIWFLTWSGDV